jgi:hypothetical protein
MRNLDSKIHLPGFDRFKFQFHSFFAETFSTASVMCGRRLIDKSFFTLMQHWSGAVMCPAC